ncbi:MAG: methyltransferase domain-containing protein [Agriterribacter sp.]
MKILDTVNVSELKTTGYPLSYLKELLAHKKYQVQIYTSVLNAVIKNVDKPKENIYLIDYGSGNGLLGLFAKFCGFKKVMLIDMSNVFIESATELSNMVKIHPDNIICGVLETPDVKSAGIPDAVVGTDVIEHIYDLDLFFGIAKTLNNDIITVFTTASNNKNWFKRRRLMQIQRQDEWHGWERNNSNEAYPSFRQLRRVIILQELDDISDNEVELLITNTRGLNKEDIVKACAIFKQTREMPLPLPHPTNTCDPFTGSWTERLLSFKEYQRLYKKHSLQLTIYKGFYNSTTNTIKGYILAILNKVVQYSGKVGMHLSPYIILVGV